MVGLASPAPADGSVPPEAVAAQMWAEYAETRSPALRERLVIRYTPLVKYVIGRLAISLPVVIDSDDVVSYGLIGLMDAIDRFDSTRGIKFESYAIPRVRGSILDALRAVDPVSRTTRSRSREIERAMRALEEQTGRTPTGEEIAAHLGMTIEAYYQHCLTSSVTVLSLDNLVESDEDSQPTTRGDLLEDRDSPVPLEVAEQRELMEQLIVAIQRLPERERLVLALHYKEELTMKEISRVLEISESRVCQLHSQAVLRLRGYMRRAD
jgi:RNA polymerase sigma factor for flagellar operon FliA